MEEAAAGVVRRKEDMAAPKTFLTAYLVFIISRHRMMTSPCFTSTATPYS